MPLFTWTQTELARKLAPPKRPCQLASRRALFAACPLPSRVASTSPAGLAPPAPFFAKITSPAPTRSEEHTSELQSRLHLVCRLLLEKKKTTHLLYTLGEKHLGNLRSDIEIRT